MFCNTSTIQIDDLKVDRNGITYKNIKISREALLEILSTEEVFNVDSQ